MLTLEYLANEEEGQYLDRKSVRIKPNEIARHLVAFANASGGVLVIGIEDDGSIIGFNAKNTQSINDFLNVPYNCKGVIRVKHEIKEVNVEGRKDRILIFYVEASDNSVIKTGDDKVYLRVGDKSKILNSEQVLQLQYDKGERNYEDVIISEATIEDVDEELVDKYKQKFNSTQSVKEVLEARGLLKNGSLTIAGILLFSKNPTKFLPQARLRLLKFDGVKMETGRNLNVIKDINYEMAIPKIIAEIKSAISLQLRDFQYLNNEGVKRIYDEMQSYYLKNQYMRSYIVKQCF